MSGLDAQFNLISYAVLTTKYESEKNILMSFLPLIEYMLVSVDDKVIPKLKLSEVYEELYGYKMPLPVIDKLLRILDNQGKVCKLKDEYIEIYKDKIEDATIQEEYKFKIRSLNSEFESFVVNKGLSIDKNNILNILLKFMIENIVSFNQFLSYNSDLKSLTDNDNELYNVIIDFLIEERKNASENYKFLKDIYYGVYISSLIINVEKGEEIEQNENLNIENVLLDSNFVFRLLNLQTEFEYHASMDTYIELKNRGCNFWIYPDTIKQIADNLKRIVEKYSEISTGIIRNYGEENFAGLASACMRNNLTPAKVETLINNLEKKIQDFGINSISDIKISDDDISKEDISSLAKSKPNTYPDGLIHDLKLVKIIKTYRNKNVYTMSQAKWWLLTDDFKLTKWNIENCSTTAIQECITETQLATSLWLTTPTNISVDAFYNSVIALRNKHLVSTDDFFKISSTIEKMLNESDDKDDTAKKISLAFSKKIVSNAEFKNLADENINEEFPELLKKAEKYVEEVELIKLENLELKDENQKIQQEYNENIIRQVKTTEKYKNAFLKEIKGSIFLLEQDLENTKEQKERVKKEINDTNIKKHNQTKACKYIIFVTVLIVGFLIIKYLVPHINKWYAANELTCNIISIIINILIAIVGINIKALVSFTNKVLIIIKFQKNYDNILEDLSNEEKVLDEKIYKIKKLISNKKSYKDN